MEPLRFSCVASFEAAHFFIIKMKKGGKSIAKTVLFGEKETDLIQKIEEYAKENNMSFDETVKTLCKMAFDSLKWGTF